MLRINVIVCISLLFYSCTQDKGTTDDTIFIDLQRQTINIQLDVSIAKHVPLESNDESLYFDAKKIVMNDSSIYLMDENVDHRKIFHFNSSGKFMAKTLDGSGPGEFIYLSDFFYDKDNEEICALDFMRHLVFYFDKNMEVKREQNVYNTQEIEHFARMNNGHWLINEANTGRAPKTDFFYYGISETDSLARTPNHFFELPYALISYSLSDPISRHYYKTIKVACPMHTKIYEILDDSVSAAYTFDFGDFTIKEADIWDKTDVELFDYIKEGEFVIGLNTIIETEKYLAFRYSWKRQNEFVIMRKDNQKYITSSELRKSGHLPKGKLMTMDTNENFVILSVPKDFIEWQKKFSQQDTMIFVKETDNDVLTLFDMKF